MESRLYKSAEGTKESLVSGLFRGQGGVLGSGMFYSKELSIFLASNSDTRDLSKPPFMSQNTSPVPQARGGTNGIRLDKY